uniref:Uncharacterized protein n=1 Tax=Arion vulgaris TaxID=1028688 RepID=A0A0B7A0D9_9EUPU
MGIKNTNTILCNGSHLVFDKKTSTGNIQDEHCGFSYHMYNMCERVGFSMVT